MEIPTVIVFNDFITSPCSWWRSQGVLSELARENKIHLTVGKYTYPSSEDWTRLRANKIAYFQRPMAKGVKDQIFMAKDLGLKIIIDLDDYNFISPSHPVYKVWCEEYDEKIFRKIMLLADCVIVSTKKLQEHYSKYSNNVVIVPNAINDMVLPFNKFSRNKIVIIRGGGHHLIDIWHYRNEIIELMQKNKDWKLIVIGGEVHFFKGKIDNYEFVADLDIHKYFAYIKNKKASLFIIPLEENELNLCKSNISWQEATFSGAASLTPYWFNLNDYSLNYNSKNKFYLQLESLLADEGLREYLWTKSVQKIKKDFVLSKVNEQRLEIIKNLLK